MKTSESPLYKITDILYFMNNNRICQGVVYEVATYTKSIWEMQLHNGPKNKSLEYSHFYKICIDAFNKSGTDWIPEGHLFETKEALIENLIS